MATQGKPISPDCKKAVVTLKEYFDRTKNDFSEKQLNSVAKTSHALKVGTATIHRIMAEYNKDPNSIETDQFNRGKPPYIMSESLQSLVRDYVRSANISGKHITLEMLSKHLLEYSANKDFSVRTLGRALDRWGFTFGKGVRTQHLKEKDHVVAARRRYLREMRANRNDKKTICPEVYLDESYVNKNHSNDFTWYLEDDGPLVQKPTDKGDRLVIIHAITRYGWVPNAKIIFKSSRKTGDYHGQMNYDIFSKWFEEKLLPNIPDGSLIIMDNASYHNVLSDKSDTMASSKKEVIYNWLESKGMPVKNDMLKAELVEMLGKITTSSTYALDEIAEKRGHRVLRTPPYHPELQPIEICWGVVKNQVARNCDFTMDGLLKQLENAFDSVTSTTCSGIIKKVKIIENDYWEMDNVLEL